jgi:hypothetical protein
VCKELVRPPALLLNRWRLSNEKGIGGYSVYVCV